MKAGHVLAALAALALLPGARAEAQRRARSGFWVDAGAGFGIVRVTCLGCPRPTTARGLAVTVSAGGTVSRYVLVGVEAQAWNGPGSGVREHVSSLNLIAQWYPWGRRNGFFLRGGTGFVGGTVVAHDTTAAQGTVKGTGLGIGFSLGWDIPVGRRLALTLQAGDQLSALGDLAASGVSSDDTIAYVSRFSLALTWR